MFNDFDSTTEDEEKGRGRMGVSLALSAMIYGVIAAVLATVVATARAVVREREVEVEFASMPTLPEPEPEPEVAPPPPPPPRPRPRTNRPASTTDPSVAPSEIPSERPAESDGELVEARDTGPVDGFTDGGGDAVPAPAPAPPPAPPAPPPVAPTQERMEVSRPSFLSGCTSPEVPSAVQRQAATIRVEVRMLVMPDGRPGQVRVVQGHPLVPDELVLACARDQVFSPARLPDGTAVPYPYRRRFVFRPHNL